MILVLTDAPCSHSFALQELCHQDTLNISDISLYILSNVVETQHYGISSYGLGRPGKLESFLHKNQRTQRKLLNFENWTNGESQ